MADKTDDYDPHEHRNVKNPQTNFQAMAHFIKAAVGTGILALPNGFANAGWVNGIIFTVLISMPPLYALHIVVTAIYYLCQTKKEPFIKYSSAFKMSLEEGPPMFRCLAPIAIPFVDGFLIFYHYGTCCVYVVFISSNIKQLVDHYVMVIDIRIHMVFLLLPLMLLFTIRDLRFLSYFSAFANFMILIGLCCIFYYVFQNMPPLSERKPFEDFQKFPLFFGCVLFALTSVGETLAIEEKMATPKDYTTVCGVMNASWMIFLGFYVFTGFVGYWKYGEDVEGSITLNIPQDELLSQSIKFIFSITTWISYALQGYISVDIIWHKHLALNVEDESKHFWYEEGIRALFLFFTFVPAVTIANLELLISFVGSLGFSVISIVIPGLLVICVEYRTSYGPGKYKLILNILLIMYGILGGLIGTGTAIKEIITSF